MSIPSWSVSIVAAWACFTCTAHAQEALVLDTYTCSQFLADLRERPDSAKVRRSLMMIAWAAGYAAARQDDAPSSLEMIAASLGDTCRNSPTENAAKAITDKINESTSRSAAREAPGLPSTFAAPAAAPAQSSQPAAAPSAAALPAAPAQAAQPAAAPSGSAAPAPAAPTQPSQSAAPPSPSAAREPSGKPFTTYSSRDMEGGDYRREHGISFDQCEDHCKRDSRCQAFSYDMWNRFCFLKSSINPLRLEPRSVTLVPPGIAVSNDDREPTIQRRAQKAFPNEPYLQASAQSYGDCAQRCLKDQRCEAFNFYQLTRRCNLIEKPKEYSDARGAEVGIKVQGPRP